MTVHTGDPWMGMSLSDVVEHSTKDSSAVFAVATGLALAGLRKARIIDLMPRGYEDNGSRFAKDRVLLASLSVAALLLLTLVLHGNPDVRSKSMEFDELKSKISRAKVDANKTRPGLATTTVMMQKIVDDLQARKNSPIDILQQLSEGLPKSCWLSELRFEAGKTVVLRGSALSNSAVADAVQLLSNSPRFQTVSPDYSNLSRTPGSSYYDFQIKCTLPPSAALIQTPKGKTVKARTVVR